MSTKLLRNATSGIVAAAVAIGANAMEAIAPFDFIAPNSAFAQDVDERTNIQVYRTHLTSFAGVQGFEVSRYFAINDRACLNSTVFCKNRDKTS